jgi:AcrR family transcriptional regulator
LERQETRERILEAAEKLFSGEGLAKTSLRAITLEAGVNVAAVHYHFGSKQALVRELFARRVEPINAERLRRLNAIEAAHPTGDLPLEPILASFIEPVLEVMGGVSGARRNIGQLIGRFYGEPDSVLEPFLREQFGEVARRFSAGLARALPELSRTEVAWRLQFMIAVLTHVVLAGHHALDIVPEYPLENGDEAAMRARLVTFLAAGCRGVAEERT